MTAVETPRTIYQKIFDGDLPAYKLYDDTENGFMAFLDIKPATVGHTLVVPREPIDRGYDLEPARTALLGLRTQRVSQRLQDRLQPLRVTEHVYGFQIPHAHRMLVPSYVRGDVAYLEDPARLEQPVDHDALQDLQDKIAFSDAEQAKIKSHLRAIGGLIVDAT
jgi:histidine triad (HIT) family protein